MLDGRHDQLVSTWDVIHALLFRMVKAPDNNYMLNRYLWPIKVRKKIKIEYWWVCHIALWEPQKPCSSTDYGLLLCDISSARLMSSVAGFFAEHYSIKSYLTARSKMYNLEPSLKWHLRKASRLIILEGQAGIFYKILFQNQFIRELIKKYYTFAVWKLEIFSYSVLSIVACITIFQFA